MRIEIRQHISAGKEDPGELDSSLLNWLIHHTFCWERGYNIDRNCNLSKIRPQENLCFGSLDPIPIKKSIVVLRKPLVVFSRHSWAKLWNPISLSCTLHFNWKYCLPWIVSGILNPKAPMLGKICFNMTPKIKVKVKKAKYLKSCLLTLIFFRKETCFLPSPNSSYCSPMSF